ncbi:hypothetical protein DFJ58DRAFT_840235 [Suillus subalutaceus]|uniref:uncharacterized protein n=1 Tax=Suillus subalutaceus TaxID=48586 RepID=UPI001B87A1BC|nr:uncharacterized protein DFJ58DRAFT_840235 [Suillus subalutaceus]KAG1859375.1 hypothetical protein DFJ58DRAFT_840235 [Suillus subalutaceus]
MDALAFRIKVSVTWLFDRPALQVKSNTGFNALTRLLEAIVWVAHTIKQEGKDIGHEEVHNAERQRCGKDESGTSRVLDEGKNMEISLRRRRNVVIRIEYWKCEANDVPGSSAKEVEKIIDGVMAETVDRAIYNHNHQASVLHSHFVSCDAEYRSKRKTRSAAGDGYSLATEDIEGPNIVFLCRVVRNSKPQALQHICADVEDVRAFQE